MTTEIWTCPACRKTMRVPLDTVRIRCLCGFMQQSFRTGLGDLIAATLHNVGMTKTRYRNMKAAVGLKRKCNCRKRQEKLNALGKWLGIG